MKLTLIWAALLTCAACSSEYDRYDDDPDIDEQYADEIGSDDSELSFEEMEENGDYIDDLEVRGGETYSDYDERRDGYDGEFGTYEGYGCTVDCSGHEAGYEWAANNGIYDPDDCGGNSWSFEEGCRAYAEENGY